MPILHIDLRDGFNNDDVILYLNDREAARQSGVTTDLTISHAATIDVPAPEGPCTLRIDVPRQHISSRVQVNAADSPYVAIFLRDGAAQFHKLQEPLPMM
ncbi:MAG: hypothetical protein WAQ52_00860 [Terriglobales bacterium]